MGSTRRRSCSPNDAVPRPPRAVFAARYPEEPTNDERRDPCHSPGTRSSFGRRIHAARRWRPLSSGDDVPRERQRHARARGQVRRRVPRSHAPARGLRERRVDSIRHPGAYRGRRRIGDGGPTARENAVDESKSSSSQAPSHLETVQAIAAETAGPAADGVDREARFPREAIDALKKARMMSAFVPMDRGGFGTGMVELAAMCEALAQQCASAAMVFAMHQIQVACIVRHGMKQPFFASYVRDLVERQNVIASVTSEVGVGGEMRTSLCGVEVQGDRFTLVKDASTISYGEHADEDRKSTRLNSSHVR